MRVDRQVERERLLHEGNELLGEVAQHDARIAAGVDVLQLGDELRHPQVAAGHRAQKQLVLRAAVPQESSRRHMQLAGDVRERGPVIPLLHEDAPRRLQQLLGLDRRWPSHR